MLSAPTTVVKGPESAKLGVERGLESEWVEGCVVCSEFLFVHLADRWSGENSIVGSYRGAVLSPTSAYDHHFSVELKRWIEMIPSQ